MRIRDLFVKHQLDLDILNGKDVLDIGCGRTKLPNSIGLDQLNLPGVDIVADLNQTLPIEDESFEFVYSNQVLEHVENLIGLVYEVHRILKPGGTFLAHVPYFRSSWAYIDPTHVRCFTIQSMNYYVKGTPEYEYFRFDERAFEKLDIFIDHGFPAHFLKQALVSLALRNPGRYENSFASTLFPFVNLSFLLTK
jgi:2-polyprenyl-3-methyl-5-hydroxy-6-metoxy-1,4-benzoquinol methylase